MQSSLTKNLVGVGALISVGAWAFYTPPLFQMVSIGAISPIAFLLASAAVISILVGGIRAQFGKGRAAFVLHIALAVFSVAVMHLFLFVPLTIGVTVSTFALFWLPSAQLGAQADRPEKAGPSA